MSLRNGSAFPSKSVSRPVPQALFAIEYDLFEKSPSVGHLFSLPWYARACCLVYGFVAFTFTHFTSKSSPTSRAATRSSRSSSA